MSSNSKSKPRTTRTQSSSTPFKPGTHIEISSDDVGFLGPGTWARLSVVRRQTTRRSSGSNTPTCLYEADEISKQLDAIAVDQNVVGYVAGFPDHPDHRRDPKNPSLASAFATKSSIAIENHREEEGLLQPCLLEFSLVSTSKTWPDLSLLVWV
ncbi:hypothetical protein LWI29_026391 [Acer saccharum]|uniref:Uncharacterized protein n=1 Tax=Acer saccharum TaxID=4024 RepID=A0AA39T6J8_ACESA|nr:hypothetical protein LWI29_026391 [Acer saccharum]